MIDPIGTAGASMPPPPRRQGGASLTEEQTQIITDTLSQYDANSLTEADAQAIVSAFTDAGIQPGKALEETMSAAGFDARTVGDMAGVKGPPPGGPQGQGGGLNISEELMEDLYALLDQYYAEGTSEIDQNSLRNSIQELLGSNSSIFSATA